MAGTRGRTPGSKNKPKGHLLAALQARFGEKWHPVIKMAEIAEDLEKPIELRAQMYKEVSQYVTPKLKAVEHSGPGGGPVTIALEEPMSEEQWAKQFSK